LFEMFFDGADVIELFIFRHAEATHNKASREASDSASRLAVFQDPSHLDARLTPEGKLQATRAREHIATLTNGAISSIELVCTSTLTRTIETAAMLFDSSRVPFTSLECLREQAGNHRCDERRSISALKLEYPFLQFEDFSKYVPLDQTDTDRDWLGCRSARETREQVELRVLAFVEWLRCRSESRIAVVSHAAFLRHFLSLLGYPSNMIQLRNCECRRIFFVRNSNTARLMSVSTSHLERPIVSRDVCSEVSSGVFVFSCFSNEVLSGNAIDAVIDADTPPFTVVLLDQGDASNRYAASLLAGSWKDKILDGRRCVVPCGTDDNPFRFELLEKQQLHRQAVLIISEQTGSEDLHIQRIASCKSLLLNAGAICVEAIAITVARER
jgi:broad specificity phosphatase PhoE